MQYLHQTFKMKQQKKTTKLALKAYSFIIRI